MRTPLNAKVRVREKRLLTIVIRFCVLAGVLSPGVKMTPRTFVKRLRAIRPSLLLSTASMASTCARFGWSWKELPTIDQFDVRASWMQSPDCARLGVGTFQH